MQTVTVRGKVFKVNVPSAHMPFAKMGKFIVGIVPWIEYDEEIYQELKDAWATILARRIVKTFRVPSGSRPDTLHTVRRAGDYYSCTCPARGECWHIKWVKRKEAGELRRY